MRQQYLMIQFYMQVVLDGFEGAPYKRVHIVRLNEPVPKEFEK